MKRFRELKTSGSFLSLHFNVYFAIWQHIRCVVPTLIDYPCIFLLLFLLTKGLKVSFKFQNCSSYLKQTLPHTNELKD